MSYEPKDMTGSLFRNDKREKDTHAHARGSAFIDGVHYWVDAWTNTTQAGDKYQSLKFKRKDAQTSQLADTRQAPRAADVDLSDSVPF